FCNAKQYIFTRRVDDYKKAFTDPSHVRFIEETGLLKNKQLSKYLPYFYSSLPYDHPGNFAVILTPGNKLPIRTVTKGEFLQMLEQAIPQLVAEEKVNRSTDKSEQARVEAEFKPRWLKTVAMMKERYKNRLNEPAVLKWYGGPATGDLYNGD